MKVFLIILISLIVLVFVAMPIFIYYYAGKQMKKFLVKSDVKVKDMKAMDITFYLNGPMKDMADEGLKYMDSLNHEDITLESFDGFKLHAYYFKNPYKETNNVFLGMHGFKSGPRHEFAPYIKKYFELGFNVLIPDERAHYLSEGDFINLGYKERIDVVDWTKYIVSRFGEDTKILIQGVSMGAASVNQASELDLPKQVIGIISDCAYSSFQDIIIHMLKGYGKMPIKPILGLIVLYLKRHLKIDLKNYSPIKAVEHAKVPILYVHGKLDQIVPVECTYKLYEKCASRKKMWIVDEANHAESVGYRRDEYFEVIKEFFNL